MITSEIDVKELLERLQELERRVAELEGKTALPVPAATAPVAEALENEEISEELLMVVTAAVASFLGVKAHVKQIRLVGREAWAQQGRVSIMASHRWAMHRS